MNDSRVTGPVGGRRSHAGPPNRTAAKAHDVIGRCRDAGCLDLAPELVEAGATLVEVDARLASVAAAGRTERDREVEIRGLCRSVRLHDLADFYLSSGMPLSAIRYQLLVISARMDVAIDNALTPPGQSQQNHRAGWERAYAAASRQG